MPFFNVFKNSFHYHILSGVLLAYFTYGPSLSLTSQASDRSGLSFYVPILLFIFSQLSNLSTHITLRNLRPPGSTVRKIPFGYGFDWVSCPNYLFESLVWVAFALLTRTYASLLFLAVSVGQMYLWSVKKHKAYKKEFSNYPKNRKIFIPYIH
jgi:very-long-chain enoyl-CoA reductase